MHTTTKSVPATLIPVTNSIPNPVQYTTTNMVSVPPAMYHLPSNYPSPLLLSSQQPPMMRMVPPPPPLPKPPVVQESCPIVRKVSRFCVSIVKEKEGKQA